MLITKKINNQVLKIKCETRLLLYIRKLPNLITK